MKAPVTAIEIEITTKPANSTGWNTACCVSAGRAAPLAGDCRDDATQAGQSADQAVDDADADVGLVPIFIGLNAGRDEP